MSITKKALVEWYVPLADAEKKIGDNENKNAEIKETNNTEAVNKIPTYKIPYLKINFLNGGRDTPPQSETNQKKLDPHPNDEKLFNKIVEVFDGEILR